MNDMDKITDPFSVIEEQKKIIEKQAVEIEMLEAAFNLTDTGILISNSDGYVLRVNPAQTRITGHDPQYTLKKHMSEIANDFHTESATLNVIGTLKPTKFEQHLPTGQSYLVFGEPYFDTDGDLKYIICNLVDSTYINYIKQKLEYATLEKMELEENLQQLKRSSSIEKKLVCTSLKMKEILKVCLTVAPFDTTVLITGESGVGKELIANYVFENSKRNTKPFLKINCAAIPENLLESELFGYEEGAFTGARSGGKKGVFETLDGGTILLDEIGEMSLPLQAKLLRVLQNGEIYRIGGQLPIHVDVRIIASTNCNLEAAIKEGKFRKDLYYRLAVIMIKVPSLQERKEDIAPLIRFFLGKYNEKYDCNKQITFDVVQFVTYNLEFEGNVRELENFIERLVLLTKNNVIGIKELLDFLRDSDYDSESGSVIRNSDDYSLNEILESYEKKILTSYLQSCKTTVNMSKALNVDQSTISRKLQKYGISLNEK